MKILYICDMSYYDITAKYYESTFVITENSRKLGALDRILDDTIWNAAMFYNRWDRWSGLNLKK